jgi:hypothetical protein
MRKITLLLFICLFTSSIYAQWTINTALNTQVVSSNSDDIKSVGTSTGKTYVVFWKVVPSPTNYELRLQVLDPDGNKLLGPDGTLVSNTLPMSTSTAISKIAIDKEDNLYIGVTGTTDAGGYGFKMNTNGVHLWNPNGVSLGSGYLVTILPLTTGEAILAWLANGQTLMQKFNTSGNPIWTSNQQVAFSSAGTKAPGDLFELSGGQFMLVFHVVSFGINSTLYAQKYDAAGNPVWAAPTQLSNKATAYNSIYSSTQDGDVVYYGYKGSSSSRFDSFLQRINPDGSTPWGINGMDFDVNQTNYEMDTKIAFSTGSQYVWSMCNYTNIAQSQNGLYLQKFDKTTGARLLTDNAKVIYAIGTYNQISGDLKLIGDQPLFLVKNGMDNGASPTTLNACLLNTIGNFAWAGETKPMATFAANKSRIHFNRPVNGKVVAVFVEQKTAGSALIYAQNLSDTTLLSTENFSIDNESVSFINPIQNELTLQSKYMIKEIQIHTLLGQEIAKSYNVNSLEYKITSERWNSGIYFVTIKMNSGASKRIKIIKK